MSTNLKHLTPINFDQLDVEGRLFSVLYSFQALIEMMRIYQENDQSLISSDHVLAQMEVIEFALRSAALRVDEITADNRNCGAVSVGGES